MRGSDTERLFQDGNKLANISSYTMKGMDDISLEWEFPAIPAEMTNFRVFLDSHS